MSPPSVPPFRRWADQRPSPDVPHPGADRRAAQAAVARLLPPDVAVMTRDEFVKQVQGDGLVLDPIKFASVLQSLPRDDAVLIEQALGEIEKQAGVSFDASLFDRAKWTQYLKEKGYKVADGSGEVDSEPIPTAGGAFI